MAEFKYTPDATIQIHRQGAIKQICADFASHDSGLPEWVKNSTAAYIKEGDDEVPLQERIIVLAFNQARRGQPASISCLDFVGMTSEQIERDFRQWADPDAAMRSSRGRRALGELGGHGNGGKCYMTQMFEKYAVLNTVRNGLACAYGVKGGAVELGYVPDSNTGRDYQVDQLTDELQIHLTSIGVNLLHLPEAIRRVALSARGFTLVKGVGPRNCDPNIPVTALVDGLLAHPQMASAIQMCKVYVLVDGRPHGTGNPLELQSIEPLEGFETPLEIKIPNTLIDPSLHQSVSTGTNDVDPTGHIVIRTSAKNMLYGRGSKRQWRHTVVYKSKGEFIGTMPMTNLVASSDYKNYMYCDCHLEALHQFKTNKRGLLAESSLTRALNAWISNQVEKYCKELEARDRRKMSKRDKDEVSKMNDWLDRWKNQFLQDFMQGLYGQGEGSGEPKPGPSLPTGKPTRVELTVSHNKAGVGVYFRPTLKFFDAGGQRVRPIPFYWVSEDTNVAMVDDELMQIRTFSHGSTMIYAECMDMKLSSNRVALDVVRLLDVRVTPLELELPAGSRHKLEAVCKLDNGEETTDVYLTWLEANSSVARVSASGLVFAFTPGKTQVTATDENCKSDHPAEITVTPSDGKTTGGQRGKGFPRIFISEVDRVPGEEESAQFRPDEPPVWQRAVDVDNNIWWINLASPFARLYFDPTKGYGPKTAPWRMYHVERIIDILVQIALTYGPDSQESLDSADWMQRAATLEADIREKAIESLQDFIQSGNIIN